MKRKKWTYAFLSVALLLPSCSDDTEPTLTESDENIYGSIIGEWLDDSMADNTNIRALLTTKYLYDGTAQHWLTMADGSMSIYTFYDGTYRFDNHSLVDNYVSPIFGGNVTDESSVVYLDNYTLSVSNTNDGGVSSLCRVSDTYNLNVDETAQFNTPFDDFKASSYLSLNPGVVKIDPATGEITAVRRGMTFVKGISPTGDLAIRVNVTDPDNYIDDFVLWMNQSIKKAQGTFGDVYGDIPGTPLSSRTFSLDDPLIETVQMDYFAQTIQVIYVQLRPVIDSEKLTESFNNKYVPVSDNKTLKTYLAVHDGQIYYIAYQVDSGMIMYMPYVEPKPDPDDDDKKFRDEDFRTLESLMGMTIQEAAAEYSYEITAEDMENGFFSVIPRNNEVFKEATVYFDSEDTPCVVNELMLSLKRGLSQDDVEPWYKEHYIATDDKANPYTNEEGTLFIQFKKSGSMTTVKYRKTKFRK